MRILRIGFFSVVFIYQCTGNNTLGGVEDFYYRPVVAEYRYVSKTIRQSNKQMIVVRVDKVEKSPTGWVYYEKRYISLHRTDVDRYLPKDSSDNQALIEQKRVIVDTTEDKIVQQDTDKFWNPIGSGETILLGPIFDGRKWKTNTQIHIIHPQIAETEKGRTSRTKSVDMFFQINRGSPVKFNQIEYPSILVRSKICMENDTDSIILNFQYLKDIGIYSFDNFFLKEIKTFGEND